MSQRDVVAELREARRPVAPTELRARVRLIAAAEAAPTAPARRVTWRRALVVALPLAAALAAGLLLTRPGGKPTSSRTIVHGAASGEARARSAPLRAASTPAAPAPLTVPPARGRAQRWSATLTLQVRNGNAVSDGVKRALRIAASLGGYPTSVHASTGGTGGSADLVLKVPRTHVQDAVTRLSALGTILGEHVDVQDAQATLNATDRTIARLQRQLKALRAQSPLPATRIAALEARVAALQRSQAATRRTTHYATIDLQLRTPAPAAKHAAQHGPLHGVGVALSWLGIGAVYALAIGGPLVAVALLVLLAVRLLRRRREDALLSRS